MNERVCTKERGLSHKVCITVNFIHRINDSTIQKIKQAYKRQVELADSKRRFSINKH